MKLTRSHFSVSPVTYQSFCVYEDEEGTKHKLASTVYYDALFYDVPLGGQVVAVKLNQGFVPGPVEEFTEAEAAVFCEMIRKSPTWLE